MLASTLLSGAAGAAGLGEINLHSRIGEELLAEIPLTGNAREINDAACFTLAAIPGADLPVITNARIRLVQNRNGTHLLLIGSKPLAEPVFSINLRAGCGIDLQRTYVLMPEAPLPGTVAIESNPAPRSTPPRPALAPAQPPATKTSQAPNRGKQAKTAPPTKATERRATTNSMPPRPQANSESTPRSTQAIPSTGDRLVLSAAPVDFGTANDPPAAGNPGSELEQRVLRMETSLSTLNQEMDALHTSLTLSTEMLAAKHELQLAQSLQQPAITSSAPAPVAARSGNNWLQLLLSTLVGGLVAAGAAHFVSRRQTARAAR